jgi:hypothetical protein
MALAASEHNALQWPGRAPARALREALARVDLFFAHGHAARSEILAAGLPLARMCEGISPIAGTAVSPMPGLPSPRIVFAGRLHPEKGPDLLLDALARLAEPPPAFLLGAGAMEPELRRRAARLGIAGRVHFEGWRDDPAAWIAGASVCVVPSRFDAWSQTAALAMGLGVPVVATAVEGLPGVLGDGRGVLVAPEDPAALAAAIEGVLSGRLRTDVRAAHLYARGFRPQAVAALRRRLSRPVRDLRRGERRSGRLSNGVDTAGPRGFRYRAAGGPSADRRHARDSRALRQRTQRRRRRSELVRSGRLRHPRGDARSSQRGDGAVRTSGRKRHRVADQWLARPKPEVLWVGEAARGRPCGACLGSRDCRRAARCSWQSSSASVRRDVGACGCA